MTCSSESDFHLYIKVRIISIDFLSETMPVIRTFIIQLMVSFNSFQIWDLNRINRIDRLLILNLILAFIVLRILKIDVSSLAQILSAGTVAIGLSLQNIISACASGIILLKSKHFRTGDYIQVQGDATAEGTVTSVGVMATALDTVNGQHVVIPNDQLRKGVITNYSRNPVRRRVVDIGVDYETDTEKCKQVLLDILAKDERVLKNPKPSVYLTDLAEYYINFSVRAYIENKDYWDVYLQFREKVLLAFREQNIQIPFRRFVLENYQEPHWGQKTNKKAKSGNEEK